MFAIFSDLNEKLHLHLVLAFYIWPVPGTRVWAHWYGVMMIILVGGVGFMS